MMWLVVLAATFCYATQALAGWLVWGRDRGQDGRVRAAAALIVGPAVVTVQMVLYHALGIPFDVAWLAAPWWVIAGWCWLRRDRAAPAPAPRTDRSAWPGRAVAAAIVAVTLATAARAFAMPIHDGDEVNNFSLFAKVFGTLGSLAPTRLMALCEPGHVEYPHLVALNQAWLFALDSDSAPWTARGFEVLGILAFALVGAGAFGCRTATQAAAAVVCLSSPPVLHVAVGFADVRLLATFVLLGLQAAAVWRGTRGGAALRLALVLGAAALTKNEGLAVAAAGTALLALAMLRQRALRRDGLALVLAGSLLGLWPAVRHALGMSLPYVEHALTLPIELLTAQVPRVAGEWARLMFWSPAAEGVFWWLATPVAVAAARRDLGARWLLAAWLAHGAVYTYILGAARPGDLEALLGTAAPRLLLHTMAWPLLILARAVRRVTAAPAGPPSARPASP